MSDTIYTLSSAAGRAAVAVIRISGPGAGISIHNLTALPVPVPRQASLRKIKMPGTEQIIDEGLVIFFPGPGSATGEDLVEFQVHGGRAVIQAIFDALATFDGFRPAEPGEFARRGFDNGKIDLTTAEGIADLIDSETQAQRRQAQIQAGGTMAVLYDTWRSELLQAQTLVEAAIDFSDEGDVSEKAYQGASDIVRTLSETITKHLEGARGGEIIRSGFRVVIAGPPNAGKSSLLNTLAKRDVAIVSDEAGTTRDAIEVHLDLDGFLVVMTDTAGIRAASSKIEQEGIRRTLEHARIADLILWMQDGTRKSLENIPAELKGIESMNIINKSDLLDECSINNISKDTIAISAKTGVGVEELISAIVTTARQSMTTMDQVVPTNARHARHLSQAAKQLGTFLQSGMSDLELRAEDLRMAASELGRLTGRIDVEDILDQIFLRFCVGK